MTDRFRLDGKIALVTGASGGLGEHFAHVLGRAGASVVVAGRRQAPLQKLAHDLGAAGIDARAIAIDVTDESSIKAGFDKAQAHFGLVDRSEEHTSELPSLMRISYAVFCLKKKKKH